MSGARDPATTRARALQQVAGQSFADALGTLVEIAAQRPDDAPVQLALAEALWGTGDLDAALARFEIALELDPGSLRARARHGLALLAAERIGDGLAALESMLAALPAGASIEDWAARLAAPFAVEPAPVDAAYQLAQSLAAVGRLDEAIAALRHGLALDPTRAPLQLALGGALQTRGDLGGALAAYRAAVRLDPDDAIGWTALARALRQLGQVSEAGTCELAARSLEQDTPDRQLVLGSALLSAGAPVEARARFERVMAAASWAGPMGPRTDDRLRVGVLASVVRANTPLDFILDRAHLATEIVLMLDGFAYPHARIASSYDVLFNAIADPDQDADAARRAGELVDRVRLPVANHPRAIADTTRERIAARLADVAGCVVPATGRYASAALRTLHGREAAVAAIGLPLLARPVGSHGGTRLERIEHADALTSYLGWTTADEIYLTRYHEFGSPDGRYRKYRFIYVDGEILPYHLAIGADWLVHYFRTSMVEDAVLRDEEARFLADPMTQVGPTAAAALHDLGQRIALEFFGIDCALLPDGRLLLFECNAAMLVRHGETQPVEFDYKRTPAQAIRDAVGRMLARRAAAR